MPPLALSPGQKTVPFFCDDDEERRCEERASEFNLSFFALVPKFCEWDQRMMDFITRTGTLAEREMQSLLSSPVYDGEKMKGMVTFPLFLPKRSRASKTRPVLERRKRSGTGSFPSVGGQPVVFTYSLSRNER